MKPRFIFLNDKPCVLFLERLIIWVLLASATVILEMIYHGFIIWIINPGFIIYIMKSFIFEITYLGSIMSANQGFPGPGVSCNVFLLDVPLQHKKFCQCSTYTETPTQQSVSSHTRPTPHTRVGALSRCHPGHRDTPVGPGRTPTVHRCPKGEAVGGPYTNTTHVVRRSTEHITTMLTW